MWIGIYHRIINRAKAWGVFTTAKKRTQITIETSRVLIVRRMHSSRTWCRECAREVDVVGLEEASALTETTRPALQECVEAGKWHLPESSDGALLICLDSLMKSMYVDTKSRMSKGDE
jgi:hypothetical protein